MDCQRLYFKEVLKKQKKFKKEETHALALQALSGDENSKRILLENHLLLVAAEARKYQNMGIPFEELMAEGNAGLLMALENWKPEKGSSFTTCAKWYIKASIVRNCMHNNRVVHLPEHISELSRTGRIDYKYVQMNIDKPNEDGKPLSEKLPDNVKHISNVYAEEEVLLLRKRIEKLLECLHPKERKVMILRYGLEDNDIHDVEQVSVVMNLTTTRINQIVRNSLQKIRELNPEMVKAKKMKLVENETEPTD
jgi:RNA polymerase primary sigma factor